jgi:hypothetical protein
VGHQHWQLGAFQHVPGEAAYLVVPDPVTQATTQ